MSCRKTYKSKHNLRLWPSALVYSNNMVQATVLAPQEVGRARHALVNGLVGRKVQEVHLATEGRHDARQQRVGEGARIACMHRCQLPQGRSSG